MAKTRAATNQASRYSYRVTLWTTLLSSKARAIRDESSYFGHIGRRKLRAVRAAQRRGRKFLLKHRLFRSDRTAEIIKPVFIRFAFPPRWHYDILRALDHFRAVKAHRDQRLAEAIEIVERTRRADGRWPLEHRWKGNTYFELERFGAPSRWNTLRALRVLKWWNGAADA